MSAAGETRAVHGAATEPKFARYAVRPYRLPAKILHWTTTVLILFMVASGVSMKQLNGGDVSDFLYEMHKLSGVTVLSLVLLRVCYRVLSPDPSWRPDVHRRPWIHWLLYALVILVPLVGWAGISDFGSRNILWGAYSLPAIWPEGAGYADMLFEAHAYLAFGMLVVVAIHVGMAMQDHMMRSRAEMNDPD